MSTMMKTIRTGMGVFSRVLGFAAAVGFAGGLLFACAPEAPEPVIPPPEEELEEEPVIYPADPEPTVPPPGLHEHREEMEGLELAPPGEPEPLWPEEEGE